MQQKILLIVIFCLSITSFLGFKTVVNGERDDRLFPAQKDAESMVKAAKALAPVEIDALRQRELDALRSEPLDRGAIHNLSILESLKGKDKKSQELSLLLAKLSLRDVASQLTAINILSTKQDFEALLYHADGLLRADPELSVQILPALLSTLAKDGGSDALANILAKEPPWRAELFNLVLENDPSGVRGYQLLTALKNKTPGVRDEEIKLLIGKLIASKDWDRAYFIFLDFLSDTELLAVGSIFDGKFNFEPRNLGFSWTISQRKNATMRIENKPGSSNELALMLDFYEDIGAFANVQQLVRLTPGRHEISFDAMASNLKTEGGLLWQINCVGETDSSAQSAVLRDSSEWVRTKFQFDVPAEGCPVQRLMLVSANSSNLDTKITGKLYFDDFTVVEVATPVPQ